MNQYDEGSKCKDTNCSGILELEKVENCSCHISPPCHRCMELLWNYAYYVLNVDMIRIWRKDEL